MCDSSWYIEQRYQPQQSVLKRQAGQRQTACIRYISAPHRSHFTASALSELTGARRADTTGVRISLGEGSDIGPDYIEVRALAIGDQNQYGIFGFATKEGGRVFFSCRS